MDLSFLQKLLGQPDSEEQAYNSSSDELVNPWPKQQPQPEKYPNSPMDPTPFNFDAMGVMNPSLSVPQSTPVEVPQQKIPQQPLMPVSPAPMKPAVQQLDTQPIISPAVVEQKASEQDILGQMQQQRQQGLANVGMLSAADQIGRAIAGQGYLPQQKLDVSHLLSQIDAPVEDYMQKQKADLEKLNLEKAKAQANNQKMKDDPNSEISKLSRYSAIDNLNKIKRSDLAAKISPNMSATQIEDILGNYNLQNMVTNYETQQNRLEMAKIRQSDKMDARREKLDAKTQDFISQRYDNLTKSKNYQFMAKMTQAKNLIDDAVRNPSGIKDVGALYSMIKMFDPESVVREGELKLTNEARSLWNKANTTVSKMGKNPRVLDKETLNQMQAAANSIFNQGQQQYRIQVKPVLDQAKKRGIKEEDYSLIDPLYDSFKKIEDDKNSHSSNEIHVTNGTEILSIDPSDLDSAIKSGYHKVGN